MNHPQDQSDHRALLAQLWHQHQPAVSAYLFAAVPNYHDAEDLLQQVAVAVARDFDKYDPDSSFIRWAIAIARNRVLNHRRSFAMSRVVFSQDTLDALAAAAPALPESTSGFKAALDRCLEKLQDHARKAFRLRYEDDLQPRQIAPKLDMSTNAVTVMLHRTRKSLGECVELGMEAEGRS